MMTELYFVFMLNSSLNTLTKEPVKNKLWELTISEVLSLLMQNSAANIFMMPCDQSQQQLGTLGDRG